MAKVRVMKVLTKSRFKLGLECPNKLFYTSKKEYPSLKQEDTFLQALAQGGFQVEELARLHYPKGILIEGNDGDYKYLWERTQVLLQQENVLIFEAAFLYENLFIRTDILVKQGNQIKLIEVKAKSFNPLDEYTFVGKKGGMVPAWKPYLFDLAFQNHVIRLCYPKWDVKNFLLMADKTKTAKVDGLNQMFRISKKANNRTGIITSVNSLAEIGESVLSEINMDQIVEDIQTDKFKYHKEIGFEESIQLFTDWYVKDEYPNWPLSYGTCKGCEFDTTKENEQDFKSGKEECFKKQMDISKSDLEKPNTFEVWDLRRGGKLFEQDKFFLTDISEDDIGLKAEANKISRTERQWIQIEKAVKREDTAYVDKDNLSKEINTWQYPLNFIDFETSAVAIPFNKGLHPYEQVAFQFSHHIVYEDGKIEHVSEYINSSPGVFPNFEFLRALKESLSKNEGAIFRYSNHENTILNAIYNQLMESNEADKDELIAFIKHITTSTDKQAVKWEGDRNMIDLLDTVKHFYYNPLMKGSNSIKVVLPAVLSSSAYLQEKYAKPIGEIALTSKNFPNNHIWMPKSKEFQSPYKMLAPIFDTWTVEQLDGAISEMELLTDGGAALTAYGKLQYTDMSDEERDTISKALLKYCELDTLAMVMIYEHFREDLI